MDKKTEMLRSLCEALTAELEEYSKKIEKADKMSAGDLEAVDKLSHALKSIKTTIAMMEADGGYSERYVPRMGAYYGPGGMSYARGRTNARRDSMGRYSREGGYSYATDGVMDEMRNLAAQLPEEHRRRIEQALDGMM